MQYTNTPATTDIIKLEITVSPPFREDDNKVIISNIVDKEYIENWNIGLDIKILFKTVMVVVKKDGSM